MDEREKAALLRRLRAAARRPSKKQVQARLRNRAAAEKVLRALRASRKVDPELLRRPMTI